MSDNMIGGNSSRIVLIFSRGIPRLSRNTINGFKWDSTDSKRMRGNDSIKTPKDASLLSKMSRPPRLAPIYTRKCNHVSEMEV